MSLLALIAASTTTAPPVQSAEPPEVASTLVAPYNAPTPLDMPPVHGGPNGTHPSVLDMHAYTGGEDWNGYRYWIAWTPYNDSRTELENPCVAASHDGITWVEPAGIQNPLSPYQGSGWNSDTDLVYDPDTGLMWCSWRSNYTTHSDGTTDALERINLRSSTDGVNWSDRVDAIPPWPNEGPTLMSQAILRVGQGDWRMWHIGAATGPNGLSPGGYRRAPSITGPWTAPTKMLGLDAAGSWHIDVIRHRGEYRAIIATQGSYALRPAVSADGITWRYGEPFMSAIYGWEGPGLYRATFVPHDNGADYHVWYGAMGSGQRICHTLVPQSLWTAL